MLQWDTDTERMWRTFLNATAWISATADHDPEPGAVDSAWRSANRAAEQLRQHLDRIGTPVADVLADPATRPRLLALAETIDVTPAGLDWALQQLQPADSAPDVG